MKGYSFQELVKLAEAAVERAGDTMTGGLTAPKVLVSGAQGTEVNALTRRDYVDAEFAKKLNLTGGTLTGDLTAPAVWVSSAQTPWENALTRKDYVDSAIAAGDALQVSKSGDTMTGGLTAPKVLVSGAQGTEVNALTRRDYVDAEFAKKLNLTGGTLTGDLTAPAVWVSSAQTPWENALTRKDYVDGLIATRAPTAHNHTAAQGNSDIVAGGHSQVGTYMLAQSRANTTQGVGYLVSGAYLRPSSAGDRYNDGVSLAGTWKLLGAIWGDSQGVDQRTALWIRVS